MPSKKNDEFLTPRQLQQILNVSRKFILTHMADRRLPGMVRVGSMWRFQRSAVEKRLAQGVLLLPDGEKKDGNRNKNH